MVKPELARQNLRPSSASESSDEPRERYGSRRLATLLLVRRARVQGEARAQRTRARGDDEREITSGL